jgi:hypothetical protein
MEETMEKIHELTPPELILLQKHLELGRDHLVETLGKRGFQELLFYARPSPEAIEKVKPDEREIAGNLSLAINTILTGSLGGWMGFSGMMEFNLASPVIFGVVLSFATLTGAAIGYQNFRFMQEEAASGLQTLQILEMNGEILREVHQKRKRELQEIQEDLRVMNQKIDKSPLPDNPFIQKEIALLKTRMRKNFETGSSNNMLTHPSDSKKKRNLSPVLDTLIHSYPRKERSKKSWFSQNSRKIFISLIPTLIGGASSLFVYLSGSTQVAKAFEYNHLVALLTSPEAKAAKLLIALFVTLYFGYSSLHSNWKNHKRALEIEKREQEIIQEESSLTVLDEQLFKFRKIHEDAEKICALLQAEEEQHV